MNDELLITLDINEEEIFPISSLFINKEDVRSINENIID